MTEKKYALHLQNFTALRSGVALFEPVSLKLHSGELAFVEGENGIGKSTLLKAIQNLYTQTKGDFEKPVSSFYLPPAFPFFETEIFGDVGYLYHLLFEMEIGAFKSALRYFELSDDLHHAVGSLSKGQRQRLYLISLMATKAPLWLLDEPIVHLDKKGRALFEALLNQHLEEGGAALIASHLPFEQSPLLQSQNQPSKTITAQEKNENKKTTTSKTTAKDQENSIQDPLANAKILYLQVPNFHP